MPTNKQRREAERRRLQRQLERRRERDVKRRRATLYTSIGLTVVLIAAIVAAVIGLSSGNNSTPAAAGSSSTAKAPASKTPTPTPTPTPTTSTATKAAYPCDWGTPAGTETVGKATKPTTTKPARTGKVTVSVATNRGPMTFTLNRANAPCTVASFISLVKQKYYDKTPCHRLTTAGIYVLQCGDPSGKGTGGPGYTVPDEAKGNETYPAGTIAMARSSAANSGGSQFFIVYKDSPNLQQKLGAQQYTVFGDVTKGLDVVTKVAAAGSNNANGTGDGAPKLKTTVTTMSTTATVAGAVSHATPSSSKSSSPA